MADYQPTFQPLYPLFMGKSQKYDIAVGENNFKRLEAMGDIRAKRITPKDTIIEQVGATEKKKTFKKYFFANQFTVSALQTREGVEDVQAQILDEHQAQADDLFLLGEGSSNSTMQNNGLFWSNDPNYRLENSVEVAAASTGYHLPDMHTKIMQTADIANQISGEKVLIVYGSSAGAKFDSLYANSDAPFKRVLAEVLEGWTLVKMPTKVTPSGTNGWIAANLDQVKLHYTALPSIYNQGVNDEKLYAWFNFLVGSMMLEVLVDDAIIRQPVTFA
jgi:hypothetical protein